MSTDQQDASEQPTVVLVHGAWADGSRACYELGRKPHRNADCTVGLVPSRFPFPLFLSLF
jgi:hypothetical protein